MMKRRQSRRLWSRGREALIAASCVASLAWLAGAGCAADLMDDGAEDEQGIAGDSAGGESGQSEDMPPADEGIDRAEVLPVAAEVAGAGAAAGESEGVSEGEGAPTTDAACVGYGHACTSTAACCGDMVCAFDGYTRYCRH